MGDMGYWDAEGHRLTPARPADGRDVRHNRARAGRGPDQSAGATEAKARTRSSWRSLSVGVVDPTSS